MTAATLQCPNCNHVILSSDRFCGQCGHEVMVTAAVDDTSRKQDVLETLTPTLVFYFSNLVLLSAYKATSLFPEGFEGLMMVSVIDIVFVVAFWGFYFKELRPLFSFSNVKIHVMGLTIAGALFGAVLVNMLATAIQVSIQDDVFYSIYLFEDTSHPFVWAVLFICIQPAIFEEVAFRGFLHTNLQRVTSERSVIYITAFIFGVIHLSFISMLWLVPLGLVFAYMRVRYNTLWYGIVGHFTYNFAITLMDFWEIV